MQFFFSISLSYQAFIPYYQGTIDKVEVIDEQGRRIWLSGRHLRKFLTKQGVYGRFCLTLDGQGQFVSLDRAG